MTTGLHFNFIIFFLKKHYFAMNETYTRDNRDQNRLNFVLKN